MRSRGVLMLVLAVLAGVMAMVLASRWLQSQRNDQISQVVVVTKPIGTGEAITAEMVQLAPWPAGNEPPGAYTDPAKLVGRIASASLLKGEPVLDGRLAPPGTRSGLSALVSPGKRAMTVRVNDVIGVAGFIAPGTYVDVLVSTQSDAANGQEARQISKIVLERMLVLAVAQDVERDATKPQVANAVTLEVTPEEAETLDLARSVGNLSLVLRNQNEAQAVTTAGATKDQLFGLATRKAPPAAAAPAASRATASVRPATVAPKQPAAVPATTAVAAVAPLPSRKNCVEIFRGPTKLTECF